MIDNHIDCNYQYKNMNSGTLIITHSISWIRVITNFSNFNILNINVTATGDNNNVTILSNCVAPVRMNKYNSAVLIQVRLIFMVQTQDMIYQLIVSMILRVKVL